MKIKLYFAILLIISGLNVNASANLFADENEIENKDSIIVTFGDKTRMIIYGENRQELQKIMKYDLNSLLRDLQVRLDSSASDTTYLKEEFNGNDYLKDKSARNDEKDYVRIGMRGVHIKDGDTRVNINTRGVEVSDEDNNDNKESSDNDSEYRRTGKRFYKNYRNRSGSPRKGFNLAVGLNAYGTNETTAGYNKQDYDLKPFGSRYVSLGYIASATVARGKNAKFGFDFGASFSWNNLMFDGNNTVTKTADRVDFPTIMNADSSEVQYSKSKLVLPYVNLEIMPTLSFSKSFISYISAGMYGGYRLGSYTKTRVEGSTDKDHVRMNYHINDIRYGVAFELGIRNFPDLFVNYDLNKVFKDGRGPNVSMVNFGIRLF